MSKYSTHRAEPDSETESNISMCDSLASIAEEHEHQPFDNLLDCYNIRTAIVNENVADIRLSNREQLLFDFLQNIESLTQIREVIQQNHDLLKTLLLKLFPQDDEEEKCTKCSCKKSSTI